MDAFSFVVFSFFLFISDLKRKKREGRQGEIARKTIWPLSPQLDKALLAMTGLLRYVRMVKRRTELRKDEKSCTCNLELGRVRRSSEEVNFFLLLLFFHYSFV